MNSIRVLAPAKINLTLDVAGKRHDGYHELVTVMQSISLADTVELSINSSGNITVDCKDVKLDSDSDNLAYKAAKAFYECAKIHCSGLHIKIVKQIPLQAGLGGGSADCAAVLAGLNKLFCTGYSEKELCRTGAGLGADVPFCTVGGTKLCRGIGEKISYVPPLESCFIVIAKGTGGISTKEAYRRIDSLPARPAADISLYDGSIGSLKKIGGNIFEKVTENEDVSLIKQIFSDFEADYFAMSGSGSALFGLFKEKSAAEKCCKIFERHGFFSGIYLPFTAGVSFPDL